MRNLTALSLRYRFGQSPSRSHEAGVIHTNIAMGKSSSLLILCFFLVPVVMVFSSVALLPLSFPVLKFIAGTLSIAGLMLLILSKTQKLKKGNLLSIGPDNDVASKRFYLIAYILLFTAFCAWIAIVIRSTNVVGV